MRSKDIFLLFASIDADDYLPPGGNLVASCACEDNVGRFGIRRLTPVEIGRVTDIDVRTRVYNLSVKQSITFQCSNLSHVKRSVCVIVSVRIIVVNSISMRSTAS
jgi:hypothetical protein